MDFFLLHIFSPVLISHYLLTDTTALHSLTSCLYIWCFIRLSPTALIRHFRRSVMLSVRLLCTLCPLRHPCSNLMFPLAPLGDGMGCFLSPNEAASFASWFHYHQHSLSICIFSWYTSPQRKSLLPFCCLCIHLIYWYSVSGAYYS